MSFLDDQRAAFLAALVGTNPEAVNMDHLGLMFLYLGVVELRTELTLLERLAGWAAANGIPLPLAAMMLGFTSLPFLDEEGAPITDEENNPITL